MKDVIDLAFRFPAKPNNIGLTTVKLIEKRENILIVDVLDAENGNCRIE